MDGMVENEATECVMGVCVDLEEVECVMGGWAECADIVLYTCTGQEGEVYGGVVRDELVDG
jgi:hypothetical protein